MDDCIFYDATSLEFCSADCQVAWDMLIADDIVQQELASAPAFNPDQCGCGLPASECSYCGGTEGGEQGAGTEEGIEEEASVDRVLERLARRVES